MTPGLPALATYLAARLVPAAATMALTFLCIQWMQPQDYAAYSATMLAVAVVAGFAGAVSGQPMLRYGRDLATGALRRGLRSVPALAALVLAPLLVAYVGFVIGWTAAIVAALAMVPLLAVMDTRRSLFVAVGRARAVFALDVSRSFAALVAMAVLLTAWSASVLSAVLAQLLAVLVALLFVRLGPELQAGGGAREIDRAYLGFGLGIAGWLAVILGLSLAERAVVVSVAGLAGSGRYAAQADVVNAVFSATGGALGSAMMPAYLDQARAHEPRAWRKLRLIWQLGLIGVSAACVAVGVLLAWVPLGRVSEALTGDRVTGLTLVAGAAVWTAAGFVQKPLELRGQAGRIFAVAVVSLLVFAAVASPLAAQWGAAGVAGAKLVAGLSFIGIVVWLARARP